METWLMVLKIAFVICMFSLFLSLFFFLPLFFFFVFGVESKLFKMFHRENRWSEASRLEDSRWGMLGKMSVWSGEVKEEEEEEVTAGTR